MTEIRTGQPAPPSPQAPAATGGARGFRRFLGAGAGSGLLGGICCLGSAIAVGAGASGLSFFTTWMHRYQIYSILASIALMTIWVVRLIRRNGAGRGMAAALRGLRWHAITMGAVYLLTLVAMMAVAALVHAT